MSVRTLRFLLRKEFLQIFRDRFMLRMAILLPIIQLLILSSAATFEVKSAKVYVVDRDHSSTSRGLVDRLRASGRFIIADASPSMALGNDEMLARRVSMIVSIPADFQRDIGTLSAYLSEPISAREICVHHRRRLIRHVVTMQHVVDDLHIELRTHAAAAQVHCQ